MKNGCLVYKDTLACCFHKPLPFFPRQMAFKCMQVTASDTTGSGLGVTPALLFIKPFLTHGYIEGAHGDILTGKSFKKENPPSFLYLLYS